MVLEWRIRCEGRVQGVGFRSAVMKQALIHHIYGYVRNCSDGSVEILAQGTERILEAFLEAIRTRPGIGSIDQCKIERHRPEETFSEFEIR